MTTLLNKLKSIAIALVVFSFFITATVTSCTPKSSESDDTEAVESDEHPTDEAAVEGEEHPSDSTATESEEHPEDSEEGEEHPEE